MADDEGKNEEEIARLVITVKWGKQKLSGASLFPLQRAEEIKQKLFEMTGVPLERQKVMSKGHALRAISGLQIWHTFFFLN